MSDSDCKLQMHSSREMIAELFRPALDCWQQAGTHSGAAYGLVARMTALVEMHLRHLPA